MGAECFTTSTPTRTCALRSHARLALHWLPALGGDRQPTAVIQNGVHHAARIAPFPAIPVLAHVYIEAQGGVHRAFAPPRAHLSVPADSAAWPFVQLFRNTPIQVR